MGPGGIPKGGAKGMCVLDGGTECRTGLRKEALAMETWGTSRPLPILAVCLWQVNCPL